MPIPMKKMEDLLIISQGEGERDVVVVVVEVVVATFVVVVVVLLLLKTCPFYHQFNCYILTLVAHLTLSYFNSKTNHSALNSHRLEHLYTTAIL